MSASRERKKRAVLAESGQSPKQIKAAQEKKRKTHRRTVGIIALVLALAIGIGLFYGLVVRPKALPKKTVALRTGDHELSAVEFSHYYYDAINSFYQNYGSYLSYFMSDPSQPIDQQVYDQETGETWAEYFKKSAADTAKFDYAVYDEAKAAGYTLSAESEQAIQDSIKTLETQVKENGFKSIDQYFDQVYGKGCKGNYASLVTLIGKTPVFPGIDNRRSVLSIGNLCAFLTLAVDKGLSGLYFPQNRERVSTTDLARWIAEGMGKKIMISRAAHPWRHPWLPGKRPFSVRNIRATVPKKSRRASKARSTPKTLWRIKAYPAASSARVKPSPARRFRCLATASKPMTAPAR